MGKNLSKLKLISETWKYILDNSFKDFSDTFYNKLFQLQPAYKLTIFKRLQEEGEGLSNFLQVMLNIVNVKQTQPSTAGDKNTMSATDSDIFIQRLEELGVRHIHYGVDSEEFFVAFQLALMYALEKHLPKNMWNAEVSSAWIEGYTYVMGHMLNGMKKINKRKSSVNDIQSNRPSDSPKKDHSINIASRYVFDFDKILVNVKTKKLFVEFCYQKNSVEQIKFLSYVNFFKAGNINDQERAQILYYIWETFIKTSSKYELNLQFEILSRFLTKFEEVKAKKSCSDGNILDEIETHVKKTLKANLFLEFQKSDSFQRYLSSCSEKELLGSIAEKASSTSSQTGVIPTSGDTTESPVELQHRNSTRSSNADVADDLLFRQLVKTNKAEAFQQPTKLDLLIGSCIEKELTEKVKALVAKKVEEAMEKPWFNKLVEQAIEKYFK